MWVARIKLFISIMLLVFIAGIISVGLYQGHAEGPLTATVELKQGVRWSDGSELTAEDVAFTYNAILDIGPKEMGGSWPSIIYPDVLDRVEVVDRYTVKFYLKETPGLAQWQYGLLQAPILSKAYWEGKFEEAKRSSDPVGKLYSFPATDELCAGPFVFKTWEPGAYAEIDANPYYYFKGTVVEEYANGAYREYKRGAYDFCAYGSCDGPIELTFEIGPHVDNVIYKHYSVMSSAALAVINGDVDYHLNPLGYEYGLRRQLEEASNVKVIENLPNGFFYLSFNLRRSPFNNTWFRKAIDCIIDREFVTDKLLAGEAIPGYSVVPPGNAFWYREPSPEERDARCIGFSTAEKVTRAVEYLKRGGFTWQQEPKVLSDGTIKSGEGIMLDGKLVQDIELLHPNAAYDNKRNIFGLHVADRASYLGVPVKSVPTGFETIISRVFTEQNFDMWVLGWGLDIYPNHLHDFFHSSQAEPGGFNAEGYSDPEYDELAEQFLAETDLERARELAHRLQEILADELPYVVLYYAPVYEAYRSDKVQYPYTEALDGLQGRNGLPKLVKVEEGGKAYKVAIHGDLTTTNFLAYMGNTNVWTGYVLGNCHLNLYGLSDVRFDFIPVLAADFPSWPPPSNKPPIVKFIFTPEKPIVGQQVTFNASGSSDPDGHIVLYEWDFGDGSGKNYGMIVTHTFTKEGTYVVKLTVTDDDGATASTEQAVKVLESGGGGGPA